MDYQYTKHSITSELAVAMIHAAEAKAAELGLKICTWIVDESGVQKAFSRMDQAPIISINAAWKKALTAIGYGLPTGEAWYNHIKNDPILNDGVQAFENFILIGGGVPIRIDGHMIGGIGISGGHYTQDEQCVRAALALIESE